MTTIVTETFYRLISYSLRARHQLFFSLYLVCKILMDEGNLAVEDYNALLRQQNSIQNKDIFDNQIKGIFRQFYSPLLIYSLNIYMFKMFAFSR